MFISLNGTTSNNDEMSDTSHVIVYLNDLNDNLPSFDQEIYFVNLREKSFSPRPIFKSTAFDLDAGENGTVKYSIESVNSHVYASQAMTNEFYVDQNDCTLYLNLYVDIDPDKTAKNFDIVLVANDLGKPQKKSKTTVLVNLIDINDNKPKITEPFNEQIFELAENNNVNSLLFQIKAFDPDFSHNAIKYQLDQDLNQDWQSFSVDNQTGQLTSLISFDYEKKREYNLRIICTDQNGIMVDLPNIDATISLFNSTSLNDSVNAYPLALKSYVDVKVKIDDLDDNEPEFSSADESFVRNISEILDIGSTVTFLPFAHDRDALPQNTVIRYKIISGNEEKKFELNEKTGELTLIDELERSLSHSYVLRIRATSKQSLSVDDLIKEEKKNLNLKSHLKVVLNIVKDKLFIEFEEKNYYVSVQQQQQLLDQQTNNPEAKPLLSKMNLKQFQLKNLNEDPLVNTQPTETIKKLESASIFFIRSHLKQRKLKRKIRFSIDMLQLIRYDENIAIKLPNELSRVFEPSMKQIGSGVLNHVANVDLPFNRTSLFDVDSYSGKIYINRDLIRKNSYQVGDKFILSVVATAYAANSTNVLNFFENTVTQLTVRLTDRDYSFMMTIRNSLNNILSNHLNPLKEMYIPRLLEADGVKLSIQDLVTSKLVDLKIRDFSAQTHHYDLIMQVGTSSDHVQINLDSFVNLWKNFSTANVFTKGLDSLTSRQPIEEEPLLSDQTRNNNSLYDFDKPFYLNWFFWVMLIVGLMMFMILGFFVNCAYLTKHHKQRMYVIKFSFKIFLLFKLFL